MSSKRIKFTKALLKWLQDANLQDPNLSAATINSLIANGYTDTDLFVCCNDKDVEGIVNDYKISRLDKLKLKLAIKRHKKINNPQISSTQLDRTHISTTVNSNKTINSSTKYSQISSNNRNNSVKIPVINLIDSDNDDNNTQSSAATSSSDMANINTNHVNHNTQNIKHTNAYALSGRNLDNQSLPKTNSDTHITSTSTVEANVIQSVKHKKLDTKVKLNEQKNIELKDIIIIDSDNDDGIKIEQNYTPKDNNNNNNIRVNESHQKKRKYSQNKYVNRNSNIATNMNDKTQKQIESREYNIISEKVRIMGQNVEDESYESTESDIDNEHTHITTKYIKTTDIKKRKNKNPIKRYYCNDCKKKFRERILPDRYPHKYVQHYCLIYSKIITRTVNRYSNKCEGDHGVSPCVVQRTDYDAYSDQQDETKAEKRKKRNRKSEKNNNKTYNGNSYIEPLHKKQKIETRNIKRKAKCK
eukprot:293288_1